jgi:hypothetical protein
VPAVRGREAGSLDRGQPGESSPRPAGLHFSLDHPAGLPTLHDRKLLSVSPSHSPNIYQGTMSPPSFQGLGQSMRTLQQTSPFPGESRPVESKTRVSKKHPRAICGVGGSGMAARRRAAVGCTLDWMGSVGSVGSELDRGYRQEGGSPCGHLERTFQKTGTLAGAVREGGCVKLEL